MTPEDLNKAVAHVRLNDKWVPLPPGTARGQVLGDGRVCWVVDAVKYEAFVAEYRAKHGTL